MNRDLWDRGVTKDSCPAWPCPSCGAGFVVLTPGSLVEHESASSIRDSGNPDWEPEWTVYRFTAWGSCSNPRCQETFALGGTGSVDHSWDPDDGERIDDVFQPLWCDPMPPLIAMPKGCPADVRTVLEDSFALYWSSTAACAGRIRVALELLMDAAEVASESGTGKRLWLDDRIKLLAETEASIAANLMGIKLVGNAGSHEVVVCPVDLLDAFEILEHALSELIDKPGERIALLAQDLSDRYAAES